jgi:Uma2 family endonuclease
MATAETTPKTWTPEDLLAIRDRPMPELVDGELVERAPMGIKSDRLAARILSRLSVFIEDRGFGSVNGAQGSYQIFPDDPRKVRIPDVSFIRAGRETAVPDGHSRVVPDLVVEVISPNDGASEMMGRIRDFLDAGVPLIWVVDPDTRTVQVLRGDGTGVILKGGDSLDGEGVLPGFRLALADLFKVVD